MDPHVPVSQSQPTIPPILVRAVPETRLNSGTTEISKNNQHPTTADTDCDSPLSALETGLVYEATKPVFDGYDVVHSLGGVNYVWPQDQAHLTSPRYPSLHRAPSGSSDEKALVIRSTRNRVIQSLCRSIPPSVVSPQTIGEARVVHMINDYQLYRVSCWFMPPPPGVHGPMIDWLRSSKMMIRAVYLGLNLFTTLNQDPCNSATNEYIGWIDKLEQRLIVSSNANSPVKDTANRLAAQLELTFIGFVSIGVALGYALLRNALPGFLRVVAADPSLVAEHPSGNLLVSFPRILSVPQQELNLFVLYDAATAFALGVPSLVEYDYDAECDPTFHGHQCAHGVPVPLVEIISQVNSWRTGSKVNIDDWQTLECRALAWQGQSLPIEDKDPSVNVARLAVQESWRHVTLIYLYMGMCGFSSHDSRVQASVAQIIQLEGRVPDVSISMHMLMHYVVVGLGAQQEQERSVIRERLLSLKGKRVWLFRGPEFSRVLDHLWQGVGVGGAPVTWDDYVQSRCEVLPL